MNRSTAAILVAALLSAQPLLAAKGKGGDSFLPDSFPEPGEKERSLKEVPWAAGAPAVVLQEVGQYEWVRLGDQSSLLMQHFRRIKLLDDAGVSDHADYSFALFGDWRVEKIEARTILPDGTLVDASENIHRGKSDAGLQTVSVAFPKAEPGAILDFRIAVRADDSWSITPWIVQSDLPVLESRFVLVPPKGLSYRVATSRLPQGSGKPRELRKGPSKAYVWTFTDIEPLPDEANVPDFAEIAKTLFIIPEEYKDEDVYVALAKDWKSWSRQQKEFWENWARQKHVKTAALAKQVVEGKTTPAEKVEAIRLALRDRMTWSLHWAAPSEPSPDDALDGGRGTTGDVAGVAYVMLKEAGIAAQMVRVNRRGTGFAPAEFPLPPLFDDLLLRVDSGGGQAWWSPASGLGIGTLPGDCRGSLAIALDGKADAPFRIDEMKAADNRIVRTADVRLDPDGAVSAESTETHSGYSAERLRLRLRRASAEIREEIVRSRLRRHVPGARVSSLEIDNLEDDGAELVIRCTWSAEGYATPGGQRLILNPNIWERIPASDWAPGGRTLDLDLGVPHETLDTVVLRLPEGSLGATLPQGAKLNAGPVGLYTIQYEKHGRTVRVRRQMRLEAHRFTPSAYSGLQRWFGDIAANDDQAIVVSLE